MMEKICKSCGETFFKKRNRSLISWKTAKYCSPKCISKDKESIEKFRKRMTGRAAWNKGNKGWKEWMNISGFKPGWNKGMKNIYVPETLESNRLKHLGISPPNKGKPMPEKQIIKIRKAKIGKIGKLSNAWKGGLTAKHTLIRSSLEGKKWVRAVFERDRFTCQHCGQVGGRLNADHIKPFAFYPELRFEISNGRTLCVSCHKKTDTFGAKVLKKKFA